MNVLPLAAAVDTDALLKTVAAAMVAGVGVTLIFSLALLGAARFAQLGREDRPVAAFAFAMLALVATLAFVVAITVGIIVMTSK
jgi:hypothetical protein